jgi:hypothetical protein
MTEPVSSYPNNHRWDWVPEASAKEHALEYCQQADGVVSGALCDEPEVVDNACRTAAPGSMTAFVCDDRKLAGLQEEIAGDVKSLIGTILGALASRP